MTNIMFEIPSNPKIEKCIITKETVKEQKDPKIIINENKKIEEEKFKLKKMKNKKASA